MVNMIGIWSTCQLKHNIDRFNWFSSETQFFDWVISDFSTVLFVLKNIDNPNFLSLEKLTNSNVFLNRNSWLDDRHKIENTNIKMISIHDFPSNIEFKLYSSEFIKKYKRRLLRLSNLIKNSFILNFIHVFDHQFCDIYIPSNEEIMDFFKQIKLINSQCIIKLHFLIPPKYFNKYNEIFSLSQIENIFIHLLEDKYNINPSRTNYNFNRFEIFEKIRLRTANDLYQLLK